MKIFSVSIVSWNTFRECKSLSKIDKEYSLIWTTLHIILLCYNFVLENIIVSVSGMTQQQIDILDSLHYSLKNMPSVIFLLDGLSNSKRPNKDIHSQNIEVYDLERLWNISHKSSLAVKFMIFRLFVNKI